MLKVVHDVEASNEDTVGGSLLDEIVRDEHGRRLVVRNAYHAAREVTTLAWTHVPQRERAAWRPRLAVPTADAPAPPPLTISDNVV